MLLLWWDGHRSYPWCYSQATSSVDVLSLPDSVMVVGGYGLLMMLLMMCWGSTNDKDASMELADELLGGENPMSVYGLCRLYMFHWLLGLAIVKVIRKVLV